MNNLSNFLKYTSGSSSFWPLKKPIVRRRFTTSLNSTLFNSPSLSLLMTDTLLALAVLLFDTLGIERPNPMIMSPVPFDMNCPTRRASDCKLSGDAYISSGSSSIWFLSSIAAYSGLFWMISIILLSKIILLVQFPHFTSFPAVCESMIRTRQTQNTSILSTSVIEALTEQLFQNCCLSWFSKVKFSLDVRCFCYNMIFFLLLFSRAWVRVQKPTQIGCHIS